MTTELRDQLQSTLGASYTLQRELGGGGMSRVFVAHEPALNRTVAVKVLPPDLAAGVNADRFKREILLAAGLQHPHIVPVLSAGETDGLPYFTMPFVEGESLRGRLARLGALPLTETVSILRDVAKALAYAHEKGIVHRDIKPDNVLLSGGSAVVTDFGVAKAIGEARGDRKTKGATLTSVGTSLGTPAYMAPEQAAADPDANHRADIYAFGVMAYEMLAGHPPFEAKSPQKLLAAQMSERPRNIRDERGDTPPLLAQLVMRCLEKEPAARPQSASDIVRILDSVTSGGLSASPAVLLARRVPLWKAVAVWAAATLAAYILARAAIVSIGLPDWVAPGALIVMMIGLPVILFTAFVQQRARSILTATPVPGGHGTLSTLAVKASPYVSWRRTTLGGVAAVSGLVLLIAGYMALRALGIGPAGSLLAAGALKDRDRVLVADFKVPSADSGLAGALAEAMRTNLGQSRVLSVVPASLVRSALQRMQRPTDSRVDLTLAREIAQREGIKAVVAGDAAPLAGGYLLSARLISASSGDELASFQETADGLRDLIPALDRLARKLRGKVGESLRAVRGDPPLDQVTTTSLEALKKYVAASDEIDHGGDLSHAIATMREAIALDSNFAMAWRKLAIAYDNGSYGADLSNAAVTRAYQLRDHLTESERLLATATYFGGAGHDPMRAAEAYRGVLALNPENGPALTNLAQHEAFVGNYAAAESLYRRRVSMPNAVTASIGSLIRVLFTNGKMHDADSVRAIYRQRFPAQSLFSDVSAYWQREQFDSIPRLIAAGKASPRLGDRSGWLFIERNYAELRGQPSAAHRANRELMHLDSLRGAQSSPLLGTLASIGLDVRLFDAKASSARALDDALARYPLRAMSLATRPYFPLAITYARAGRPDRARGILAEYKAAADTGLQRAEQQGVHDVTAEIALAEGRPLDAIAEFRRASIGADGTPDGCDICLTERLGRAFDAANMPDSALVMYQSYLDSHFGWRDDFEDPAYRAGIERRLGELYDAKGDRGRAALHYQKFVDLWKNADPELQPKVAEVKQRLARLKDLEPHR